MIARWARSGFLPRASVAHPEVQLPSEKPRCIILLSTKSSGSSAVQSILARDPHVSHVRRTRHNEHETLYWVKAASILGLPQVEMADSEVPIPRRKARREVTEFLRWNLGSGYEAPTSDRELVFGGWRALCDAYAPVFLEKSPHHLHQWSALELILDCVDGCPGVDFLLVGLIRNPMDTLYSMWRRRRESPEVHQHEWRTAYENLRKLGDRAPNRVVTVRYEDVAADVNALEPVCRFAGVGVPPQGSIHSGAIGKWRTDGRYGFQLDADVAQLARSYGYPSHQLENSTYRAWRAYRNAVRWPYVALRPARLFVRTTRKRTRER